MAPQEGQLTQLEILNVKNDTIVNIVWMSLYVEKSEIKSNNE